MNILEILKGIVDFIKIPISPNTAYIELNDFQFGDTSYFNFRHTKL
jgi:hypothetical protein